eukprot:TRINITY_DN2308_c7_g1_i1.p1 TRINITY_DN2308_c7_g1~~TRINITY_DN2308_c7_g1_i1.p1  ORF type:complete len:344 (+),score=75.60 TRINITY_DN2308_c7_g1_i1:46-1032(+)
MAAQELLEEAVEAGLRLLPAAARRPAGAKDVRRALAAAGTNSPESLLKLAESAGDSCPPVTQRMWSAFATAVHQQRLDVRWPCSATNPPIVFTAPHNIYLCRDKHRDHAAEDYTASLARTFAGFVDGGYLVWTKREQRRINATKAGDPSNRDPNFLLADELKSNAWSQRLRQLRGDAPLSLHCDIHGCIDPHIAPHHYKAHVHAGLSAMDVAGLDTTALRAGLQEELSAVLGQAYVVDTNPTALTGAWTPARAVGCGSRMTVAQQAVAHGFTHSMQLELCYELRLRLFRDKELARRFCLAVVRSWTKVVSDHTRGGPAHRARTRPTRV